MNPIAIRACIVSCLLSWCATAIANPPYDGTIFIDPNIITDQVPTTYVDTTYAGQGIRAMFDRRTGVYADYNAYLFNVTYADGFNVEFEVNPEYGSAAAAQVPVDFYAPVVGRLPHVLRTDVQKVWIHMGDQAFGGGAGCCLLIHTGSIAQSYIDAGILEETLAHEATHTSLDTMTYADPAWAAAAAADVEFISTYARDNPTREDVAESFVPFLAVTASGPGVSDSVRATIEATIPHRLAYLRARGFDLSPMPRIFASGFQTP